MMQQELNLCGNSGVTLFGVGGAGGNAAARLLGEASAGMKVICANTDVQAMRAAPLANQLQLGRLLTGGLGAGARSDIGRASARESLPEIIDALKGTALCIVAAGMGGGTGTGAAPVIARAARERGILTIGIAIKPFGFEGTRRARTAAAGVAELEESVDALVVVCNEHLFRVAGPDMTFRSALDLSDSIVCETATDFAGLIAGPALKRVTLSDLQGILKSGGRTVIGYGERRAGADRAMLAAASALRNPLLEDAARGAQRLLVTIAGGPDLRLFEVEEAVAYLREHVHEGVDLVWGSVVDSSLQGRVRVGITATGLPASGDDGPATMRPLPEKVPLATRTPVAMCDHAALTAATPMIIPGESRSVPIENGAEFSGPVPATGDGLALDIAKERPAARSPVRSRCDSASLVDRIYFATRDLKRSWQHRRAVMEPPVPRRVVAVGSSPQHAAG